MIDDHLGLEILKEIARIASSTLDLDETLEKIIRVIQNKMRIDASAIYLADDPGNLLHLRASSGLPVEASGHVKLELGKGVTGWVAEHKRTLALPEAMQDPRFVHFPEIQEERFVSMLSVPILFDDACIGVINVHTLDRRDFSAVETAIVETIANQVAGALRNALLFHNSQRLLKEQSILYDISLAVQTTLKLEHGLWVILSGITMGEAGGFNRAMLFLVNEKTQSLDGEMGIGPDSPEDASRIWAEWGKKNIDLLNWIMIEADRDEFKHSKFNRFVCSLSFPLGGERNILTETALQKQPFVVTDPRQHHLVSQEFIETLGIEAFATVPLVAHETTLGVILVDNRYNRRPITQEQLRLLTRFTTHASWVIENTRLFSKLLDTNQELLSTKEQLIEKEKLAALGEVSAEVAHEIKNPLVSIGGFARRLEDKLKIISAQHAEIADLKKAVEYSNIIHNEVDRLEQLLKNILLYSQAGTLQRGDTNINEIIEDVISIFKSGFYGRNINLNYHPGDRLPPIQLDRQKIRQVFINLFYNAMDCMSEGGKFSIETRAHPQDGPPEHVTVRINDTGGGIPEEAFQNIFNPFFTTKSSGTGLGLSICRKIIEGHGGTIHIVNNIGTGITIYIHLPLQKPADYYKN